MKIGDVDLGKYPVVLAPMEDVTDIGFRLLCRQFGASMVYSEFVAADALIRKVNKSLDKIKLTVEERPAAIQIYGREVGPMVEAARIVEETAHPDVIDINFGCPMKKIAGKGAGAGMLQNIPQLLAITEAVVKAVKTPVTVKTRLGWDAEHIVIDTLAEQLQDCGISALTIHGRTRAQMYNGAADWEAIGRVKNNPRLTIPIIGNGDVSTPEEAKEKFERFGVDAVMIGRATFGQPWIFRDIRHYLDTGMELPPMYFDEKLNILKQQVLQNVERIDEYRGILHARRHLAASPLFKGIPNFRNLRIRMLRATTVTELFSCLDDITAFIADNKEET